MLAEVLGLRVGAALRAAAFCFFECVLSLGGSGPAAEIEEQFAVEGIDAGDRLLEVSFEEVMRGLRVGLAGVEASERLFGDCVAGGLFAVGGDMPVNTGILGPPLVVACLGDERPDVGCVLLVEDVEVEVPGAWVVHGGVSIFFGA
jgi:hypothetical protein